MKELSIMMSNATKTRLSQALPYCVFFLCFFSLYNANLFNLAAIYLQNDIFGADCLPAAEVLGGVYPNTLHPVFSLLQYPAALFKALFSLGEFESARLTLALLGGCAAALAYSVFAAYTRARGVAELFTALFCCSFSTMVFFSIPETYSVSCFLVLVFLRVLAAARERTTGWRLLLLGGAVFLAACNNLPLITLLVPAVIGVWPVVRKDRSLALTAGGIALLVVAAVTVFACYSHPVLHSRFVYSSPSVKNYLDLTSWKEIGLSFFLTLVISPVRDLGQDALGFADMSLPRQLLCGVFLAYIVAALVRLVVREKDSLATGLFLWILAMGCSYIWFNPAEAFLYTSQIVAPLMILCARYFERIEARGKFFLGGAFLSAVLVISLSSLYRDSPRENRWFLREPSPFMTSALRQRERPGAVLLSPVFKKKVIIGQPLLEK